MVKGCFLVFVGFWAFWLWVIVMGQVSEVLVTTIGTVGGAIVSIGVFVFGIVWVVWFLGPKIGVSRDGVKRFVLWVVLFHGAGFLAFRAVTLLMAALGREDDLGWFPFTIWVSITAVLMWIAYRAFRAWRDAEVAKGIRETQLRSLMGHPEYAWRMAVAADPELVQRVMRNYQQVVQDVVTQIRELTVASGQQLVETERLLRAVEAANPAVSLAPWGDANRAAMREALTLYHGRILAALSRMPLVAAEEQRRLEAEVASLLQQLPR
jgi:hypothetical protein